MRSNAILNISFRHSFGNLFRKELVLHFKIPFKRSWLRGEIICPSVPMLGSKGRFCFAQFAFSNYFCLAFELERKPLESQTNKRQNGKWRQRKKRNEMDATDPTCYITHDKGCSWLCNAFQTSTMVLIKIVIKATAKIVFFINFRTMFL